MRKRTRKAAACGCRLDKWRNLVLCPMHSCASLDERTAVKTAISNVAKAEGGSHVMREPTVTLLLRESDARWLSHAMKYIDNSHIVGLGVLIPITKNETERIRIELACALAECACGEEKLGVFTGHTRADEIPKVIVTMHGPLEEKP